MNKLKYYFFIIVIIFLGVAFYLLYNVWQKDAAFREIVNYDRTEPLIDFNLGISNFDSINPYVSNNKFVLLYRNLLFESLFEIDENLNLQTCLIDEYAHLSDKIYIFTLNNNIYWHDGTQINSNDIKNCINFINQNNDCIFYNNVANIDFIECIDEHIFKVHLKKSDEKFEYKLIFPLVKIIDNDLYGTGMFKIDKIGNDQISLIKNNLYWKENVNTKIAKISILLFNDIGSLFDAFKDNKVDLIITTEINYFNYIGKMGYEVYKFNELSNLYDYNKYWINTSNVLLVNTDLHGIFKPNNFNVFYFFENWYKK